MKAYVVITKERIRVYGSMIAISDDLGYSIHTLRNAFGRQKKTEYTTKDGAVIYKLIYQRKRKS